MKNTIGRTMAETTVINVLDSNAVQTDDRELIHASKMFFVSFIFILSRES